MFRKRSFAHTMLLTLVAVLTVYVLDFVAWSWKSNLYFGTVLNKVHVEPTEVMENDGSVCWIPEMYVLEIEKGELLHPQRIPYAVNTSRETWELMEVGGWFWPLGAYEEIDDSFLVRKIYCQTQVQE